MLKLKSSGCIDAPVAKVWAALSDLGSIHLWVEAITHSHCPAQSRGVGAVRICELKQATLEETIIDWEEGTDASGHSQPPRDREGTATRDLQTFQFSTTSGVSGDLRSTATPKGCSCNGVLACST